MKNRMHKLILVLFGFFSALTIHSIWGRVSAAFVGIFLAIALVSSMTSKWKFLLLLVFPVSCFLIVSYAGNGLNSWLNENTPEDVLGDIVYYFAEAGKTAAPAVQGTTELVKTGNPDALTQNGLKLHHCMMLLVSVVGAFVLCFTCYANKNKALKNYEVPT